MLGLQRQRMSFEEWEALPEKPKAEWVDGEAVWAVSPPGFDHGLGQPRLAALFQRALAGTLAVTEVEVVLPHNRIRIPDVSVVDHRPCGRRIEDPPVLVAEILSPSTRGQDLVTKAHEYAAGGIGQYWLLDPESRTLLAFELVDGGWQQVLALDAEHPSGRVVVGSHGTVEVHLEELLDY